MKFKCLKFQLWYSKYPHTFLLTSTIALNPRAIILKIQAYGKKRRARIGEVCWRGGHCTKVNRKNLYIGLVLNNSNQRGTSHKHTFTCQHGNNHTPQQEVSSEKFFQVNTGGESLQVSECLCSTSFGVLPDGWNISERKSVVPIHNQNRY